MAEVIVKHDLRQRRSLKTPVQRRGGGGELEAMWACHGALGTTSCRASGGDGAGGRRETQEAGTLATNTVADRLDKRTKVGLHHLREGGVRDQTKMSSGPTHGECLGVRRGDAGHTCPHV